MQHTTTRTLEGIQGLPEEQERVVECAVALSVYRTVLATIVELTTAGTAADAAVCKRVVRGIPSGRDAHHAPGGTRARSGAPGAVAVLRLFGGAAPHRLTEMYATVYVERQRAGKRRDSTTAQRRGHEAHTWVHQGRETMKRLICTALAVVWVALLGNVSTANADGYFCPGPPNVYMALNGGARCVWVYHNNHRWLWFRNDYTNVSKCIVVKPNSDGSGGNVGGQVDCRPLQQTAEILFGSPGVSGYGTAINDSSNYHTGFRGWMGFW
jgi:hypothetical protein